MDAKNIIIGLVVIIVLGGGFWFVTNNTDDHDGVMMEGVETMMAGDESPVMDDGMMGSDTDMMESDTMMNEDGSMMMTEGDTMMMSHGSYEAYSEEKLVLATDGKVVLFFHADWCPTCRALEADINATSMLPTGVHILKVNYDTAIALRQKYGVTTQHTFVQVNAEGESLQKFSDATKVATVIARLK